MTSEIKGTENIEGMADKKCSMKLWAGFNSFLAIGAVLFATYSHFSKPQFIAFDIKGTTDSFLQQLQQSNLDDAEKSKRVKRFEQSLQSIIDDYKQENVIVLVKPAVISNVPDKTNEIKRRIAQRIKRAENVLGE